MRSLPDDWRQRVIADARSWLYTPYQHKGHVKGVGVDCGALLYHVYEPYFGPFKPFPTDYPADWALHQSAELYLDFIIEYVEPVARPTPGGIAVFHVGRNFSHGAICSDRGKFIHSWGGAGTGCVVETSISFMKRGEPRAVKYFDVRKEWLLSHH